MSEELVKYSISNPETGQSFEIEGPAGATDEEISSVISAYLQETPQQQAPQQAPQPQQQQFGSLADSVATTEAAIPQRPDQYRMGLIDPADSSGDFLSIAKRDEEVFLSMTNNPRVPLEQLNEFLIARGKVPYSDQDLQAVADHRALVQAGEATPYGRVKYQDPAGELLGEFNPEELELDPDKGAFMASLEQGITDNPVSTPLAMWTKDFFDGSVGGVTKDDIRAKYPWLDEERIEVLHDEVLGEQLRRMGVEDQLQVQASDAGVVTQLAGNIAGGISPLDAIPFSRAARMGNVARQFGEAAALNVGMDAVDQGVRTAYGTQDNYDVNRAILAAGTGAALQGALNVGAGVAGNIKARAKGTPRTEEGVAPPLEVREGEGIPAIEAKDRRTKAYREQSQAAVDGVVARVNETVEGWTNAPEFEVHTNFGKMDKSVPRTSLGFYDPETGKVSINTEGILREADRLNVSPDELTRALVFHESLGHGALDTRFRGELEDTLSNFYENGSRQFRQEVDKWKARFPNAYGGPDSPLYTVRATEEVLAEMAEKGGELPVSVFDQIANLVKKYARQLGIKSDWEYSQREIRSILALAQRDITKGRPAREGFTGSNTGSRNMAIPSGELMPVRKAFNDNRDSPSTPESGYVDQNLVRRDKKGKPVRPSYVMGDEEAFSFYNAMADYYANRALKFSPNTKSHQNAVSNMEYNRGLAQKYAPQFGRDRRTLSVSPMVRELDLGKADYGNPEPSNNRYMMLGAYEKDGPPIREEDLTADDLINSENALNLLNRVIDANPAQGPMNLDDLMQAVTARGVKPSDMTRLVRDDPGALAAKLFRYDVAMRKLDDRVAELQPKIDSGTFTDQEKLDYIKALGTFQELSQTVFGLQSDIGRALRALRNVDYTKKRVVTIRDALKDLGPNPFSNLDDPESFKRFAQALRENMEAAKADSDPSKGNQYAIQAMNMPRALMSSYDASAPLRQGIYFITHKEWWAGVTRMPSYFKEINYNEVMDEITTRPNYNMMLMSDVAFASTDGRLSSREEDFMSDWAKVIPGVSQSERLYNGFLNKLRADVFDRYIKDFEETLPDFKEMNDYMRSGGSEGKAPDADHAEVLRGLAAVVNAGTGRANLPDVAKKMAPVLNGALFSPRLVWSRLKLLYPGFYKDLPPPVRKMALRNSAKFAGVAAMTLGLIDMAFPEAEVESDPRSSDFGKVKIGNTRYDPLGGFGQYITLGARMFTGQRVNSIGEVRDYKSFSGIESAWDISQEWVVEALLGGNIDPVKPTPDRDKTSALEMGGDFIRNKASPNASFVLDMLSGENAIGEETELVSAVASRLTPMYFQDAYEMVQEEGLAMGGLMAAPGLFGVGTQTYVPGMIDPDQELEAPEFFSMKDIEDGTNELIEARGGYVYLSDEAQELWKGYLNQYFTQYLEPFVADESWVNLSDQEKKTIIEEAKKQARTEAKKAVLPELGISE